METHRPLWIRGPQLRQRWGGMANSTFYDKIKRGLIPEPEYPFGASTPYWRLAVIEAIEARAAAQAEMRAAAAAIDATAPNEPAPKRKPGRPRKVTTAEVPA
jgi:hypothetical protein